MKILFDILLLMLDLRFHLLAFLLITAAVIGIVRLLRGRFDARGIVIPIVSAVVLTVIGCAALYARPIVEIPAEYEAFVEADEIEELQALLPSRNGLQFKYKIEITDATESYTDAWFYYVGSQRRTYCHLKRSETGFEPMFESEPSMGPLG